MKALRIVLVLLLGNALSSWLHASPPSAQQRYEELAVSLLRDAIARETTVGNLSLIHI